MEACRFGAITRDPETGIVRINEEKCNGCMLCRSACPWGADTIGVKGRKVIKCDLCDGQPECVEACLPGALRYVARGPDTTREKWRYAEKRALTLTSVAVNRAK